MAGEKLEDGVMTKAAPECRDQMGWVYFKGHCYMFSRLDIPVMYLEMSSSPRTVINSFREFVLFAKVAKPSLILSEVSIQVLSKDTYIFQICKFQKILPLL